MGVPLAEIRYFEEIGSTNDIALQWVEQGAADASLVVADTQTQGRGRMQRKWITTPGAALAFSLVLRPEQDQKDRMQFYSPLGALAICQVLREKYQLDAQIKWPNDVLIKRRKTCGILTEAYWLGQEICGVVIGIGINIAPESIPRDGEVLYPVTCLENETGLKIDRWVFLKEILDSILIWRQRLCEPIFFEAWQKNLAFVGAMVRIGGDSGSQITGQLLGITTDGSLRILQNDRQEVAVKVGDVHLRVQ